MVTFGAALALLTALLALVPLFAHLLQRSRAVDIPFPPTRLVTKLEHAVEHPQKLEHRSLLMVRMATVIVLAVLGAAPALQCDRLHLARPDGSSLGLALVLDDSASMQAVVGAGETRFERARRVALALVAQARDDDQFTVVLAGKPARLALMPTRNRGAVRRLLERLTPSDRGTELERGIGLATAALAVFPPSQRRIAVLSDHRTKSPETAENVWWPAPELTSPVCDCGIQLAHRLGSALRLHLACTPSCQGTRTRVVELFDEHHPGVSLAQKPFLDAPGQTTLLADATNTSISSVRLDDGDANPANDQFPVYGGGLGLAVLLLADPERGRPPTGGRPVLEQALLALDPTISVTSAPRLTSPLVELPHVDLVLFDDPAPLAPAERAQLKAWVESGRLAVALLGPAAQAQQLGHLLSPFVDGRVTWELHAPRGLDVTTVNWLGDASASLAQLSPTGRVRFDLGIDGARDVIARWADGVPFALQAPLGEGQVITVSLPSLLEESELSLRSGFLSWLKSWCDQSRALGRLRLVEVGERLHLPSNGNPIVMGESGRLEVTEVRDREGQVRRWAIPERAGRYRVIHDKGEESRFAVTPVSEFSVSNTPTVDRSREASAARADKLDITRWMLLPLGALLLTELTLLLSRRRRAAA
jgi:hypothetical protein